MVVCLFVLFEHWVEIGVGVVNVLPLFRTCEYDLAANENENHDLGLHHAVDEAGEDLRLVAAVLVVCVGQWLETNREANVARSHNVLNLELSEAQVETDLSDRLSVFSCRLL